MNVSVQHPTEAAPWLGVSWQGVAALIPLAQAGEIIDPMRVHRLPRAQPWVVGVASLRGKVSVVVDWVRWLDLPMADPLQGSAETLYWVNFNATLGVDVVLCVDQLLGLRAVADLRRDRSTQCPRGAKAWYSDAQGKRWLELDLLALAQQPKLEVTQ